LVDGRQRILSTDVVGKAGDDGFEVRSSEGAIVKANPKIAAVKVGFNKIRTLT
jgi:hypothetical protein